MKFIATLALALALMAAPTSALACSDPVVPSFADNLRHAKNVFVFRLVSLELTSQKQWPSSLSGRISVVRVLKGGTPATSRVSYVAGVCCNVKLSVGRYYLAALRGNSSLLSLVPGDQSIIDVTDDFTSISHSGGADAIGPVQAYLSGKPLPPGYPGNYRLESTISCPPLPAGT